MAVRPRPLKSADSKPPAPVNVGIIGTGIGGAHFDGYSKLKNVRVVGLVDVDPARGKSVAERWGVPVAHAFTNHQDLLSLKELDAVSVCTPNYLHAQIAIDALNAGKHVICEKPMAATLAQAKELFNVAKQSDKIFMMGYNNRYRGDTQLLKKYIEAGELGDLYYGKCGWIRRHGAPGPGSWFSTKSMSGGGPLIDLGVHALDLAWWLMGKPKPVSVSASVFNLLMPQEWERLGRPGTMDVEDAAVAHIRFANGAAVLLEVSWLLHTPKESFYCQVMGTKGGASAEPEFRICQDKHGAEVDLTPRAPNIGGHPAEIAHFVQCIRTNTQPLSTAEDGLLVMKMLDAIYRSGESGKAVTIT
ncbi:MAG TPA: Gfo/Idh/MocA family oxidoreductase [Candidatus Latescibacteria bacterium]|nr:Gfo/Idh/MocA family oxidoreductase [Candidatus Latescibacterota bacterium]